MREAERCMKNGCRNKRFPESRYCWDHNRPAEIWGVTVGKIVETGEHEALNRSIDYWETDTGED